MLSQLAPPAPASAASPAARALLDAVRSGHPHRLVRGASGTGKSALLALVRETAPSAVATTVAGGEPAPGSAVVIDDAHLLPAATLGAITALAARTDLTLVVAAEPRPGNDALRGLVAALDGTVTLGHLSPREVAARGEMLLGASLPAQLATLIHRLTGGLPRCVDAAFDSLRGARAGATTGMERSIASAVASCHAESLAGFDADLLAALAVAAIGAGLDGAELARQLSLDPAAGRDLVDRARGCGLLQPSDTLLVSVAEPLRATLGAQRLAGLQVDALHTKLSLGALDLPAARAFASAGIAHPDLSEFLCSQADSAAPRLSAVLYEEAVWAGGNAETLALRRAEAAGRSGDVETAARLADGLLERAAQSSPEDLAAAVRIAASTAARQGMLARSADLYEWLGADRAGTDRSIAEMVLLAAGRPGAAATMAGAAADAPPTSATAADALLAAGLRESMAGSTPIALNSFSRALSLAANASRPRLLPDSAAAVTALAALHCGELGHAQSVLQRALDGDVDGSVDRIRHELLLGWVSMVHGDLECAAQKVDSIPTVDLRPRDSLFAAALRVGLARRTGDIGALRQSWDQAQGVIAEHSVDVFSLLPLGELWLGAARLGEIDRLAHLIDQAEDLLTRLGEPTLWGSPLHWYGVQAAILTEAPADLLPHAAALGAAAETSSYAAGLARAGRAWLRVLQGEIDATQVEQAACTLGAIGLPWDGARLASEAALRVADTATATALLQVARSLRPNPTPASTGEPTAERPIGAALTERESDVARLLVTGLTYRDIGGRLFISAKTVEHHVARIRRRLGAQSRAEMLSMLRAMGHGA
ncbi:LuxR C-terminal-related transcriptional regulator [Rhodococcus sp. NPDC127528]|uniref:LuxR C-terminal-related transcriptional regulator n=1 Tax=unclassified Rhodococcus (in: high G+C Gram-positive bacteria) TaxID=192944 RepID=UPI00362F5A86